MELHIRERLLIPTMLPERGTFMEFNIKKSIIRKIALTDKDKADYSIVEKPSENRVEWDIKKDAETPLDVQFTKDELDYMAKACEALAEREMPDVVWAVAERVYDEANK